MKIKQWLVPLTILFIFSFGSGQPTWAQEKKAAPDFTLQDLQHNAFTLSSYKDKKAVMLLFWTTWCPFCRQELKMLKGQYPELAKEGLELAAINAGESFLKVDNFAKTYDLPFRVLLDQDNSVTGAFGIFGVPTYVLIDKKGHIRLIKNYFPKQEYKRILSE